MKQKKAESLTMVPKKKSIGTRGVRKHVSFLHLFLRHLVCLSYIANVVGHSHSCPFPLVKFAE